MARDEEIMVISIKRKPRSAEVMFHVLLVPVDIPQLLYLDGNRVLSETQRSDLAISSR
jgi:hypothetical protein